MFLRLMILLGLVAFKSFTIADDDCHACVHGVCYEINKFDGDSDRFPILQFAIDRTDNLVYFSYLNSLEIRALNLTDKTTKSVLTIEHTVLELAVNQATRDLYYKLENGDFYKYNLVSKQKVALLRPPGSRSRYLFFISNKLYVMMAGNFTSEEPKLFEYVPEKSQFELFEPLKDFGFLEEPFADGRGDIYFKHLSYLFKLSAGSNSITLISRGNAELDGIGEITLYGADKDGIAYFMPAFGKALFNLAPDSNEFKLVGAINSPSIQSLTFDRYNNILYDNLGLRYLTATNTSCKVRSHRQFLSIVNIVKEEK